MDFAAAVLRLYRFRIRNNYIGFQTVYYIIFALTCHNKLLLLLHNETNNLSVEIIIAFR